jgi:hypothetical protein
MSEVKDIYKQIRAFTIRWIAQREAFVDIHNMTGRRWWRDGMELCVETISWQKRFDNHCVRLAQGIRNSTLGEVPAIGDIECFNLLPCPGVAPWSNEGIHTFQTKEGLVDITLGLRLIVADHP